LADSEKNQSYFDALRNQWFGTKMPAIEVQKGPVELSEIDRLSAELELMKQINPEVEKASNEINARMNFLTQQEQDLKKAIEDLEKIIHRSQSQMQKSFAKSFERINKNFSNSFVGLFGGGKARLSLQSSGGGFGVEIDVQLPGKKSQNLSSLSGGEKALASVALLAAILRSNPSPFVVLDEVDAALDEENTKKFATVIADITRHSQVLVITHNHETMSAATELIGITTSGSNNSHVIKVKLDNLPVTAMK
jgi:chromosome segregation protein